MYTMQERNLGQIVAYEHHGATLVRSGGGDTAKSEIENSLSPIQVEACEPNICNFN